MYVEMLRNLPVRESKEHMFQLEVTRKRETFPLPCLEQEICSSARGRVNPSSASPIAASMLTRDIDKWHWQQDATSATGQMRTCHEGVHPVLCEVGMKKVGGGKREGKRTNRGKFCD